MFVWKTAWQSRLWRFLAGPIFTLLSINLVRYIDANFEGVLIWPPLLMAALAFSAYYGGTLSGIFSWLFVVGYFVVTVMESTETGFTPQIFTTLISVSATLLLPVLALGLFRRNAESRASQKEKETLQRSEEKYRTLFELAPDVVYSINALGFIDSLSPSFKTISGYNVEDWIGRSFVEIVHPDDRKAAFDAFRQSMHGKNVALEMRAIGAGGRVIDIDIDSRPRRENGIVTGSIGYARDITLRKKAESELRSRTLELAMEKNRAEEERAKLQTIVTSIGDAVFAVDEEGLIVLMNKAAEELTGFQAKDAEGKHYSDIFRFSLENMLDTPYPDFVAEVIKSGQDQTLRPHSLLLKRDGTSIPVSDIASPYRDENGKILGAVVAFHDYTRERALERAKDEFISVASHQLRTPLGSMRWTIEMLLNNGEMPSELRPPLEQLHDNSKRMIGLVNDLLNVSRIDQGLIPDDSQYIKPAEIITTAIEQMKQLAEKFQVSVIFNPPAEQFEIWFDPSRFHEVVENLVSNAIKYNHPQGSVTLTLEQQGDLARLTVADTGQGIPQHEQNQVFKKFFRAANAVQSDTEGSGLGLFVVKSYVEKWGGRIWFESQEGQGTKFIIEFPLRSAIERDMQEGQNEQS